MMKLLIVCVNYNSYESLTDYLESLDKSLENLSDIKVDVFIADNSTEKQNFDFSAKNFTYKLFSFPNLGYFGGAFEIINTLKPSEYKYTIISNVDVKFDKNAISELVNFPIDEKIAWVAPKIYSLLKNKDNNPQRLNRCSKKKLLLLLIMYKLPFLCNLYKKTFYNRKRKTDVCESGSKIYCGHGSVIILTSKFFENYQNVKYPIFLYGEEIFLAELIMKKNLEVVYYPEIIFYDDEHVSTKKLGKNYFKFNFNAIKYILKEFY